MRPLFCIQFKFKVPKKTACQQYWTTCITDYTPATISLCPSAMTNSAIKHIMIPFDGTTAGHTIVSLSAILLVVRCLLLVLLDLLVLFLSDDREHPNVLVNFGENCSQIELGGCLEIDQKPRGVHSLLYFAYTCVRDLFIEGVIYLTEKIIR
jgi:hypothetical protein